MMRWESYAYEALSYCARYLNFHHNRRMNQETGNMIEK